MLALALMLIPALVYAQGWAPLPPNVSATAFNPGQLAPAMWLRADVGVTLNAGNVSSWADQSGNGNNATQATPASQPLWVSSNASIRGKPTIRFAGATSTYLGHSLGGTSSNFTVWVVVVSVTQTSTNFRCLYGNNAGVLVGSNGSGTSGDWGAYDGATDDGGTTIHGVGGFALTWVSSTPTGTQTFYTNGGAGVNVTGTAAYPGASGLIGQGGGGAQTFGGELAEIAVFNTQLTAAQVSLLYSYAHARYGI